MNFHTFVSYRKKTAAKAFCKLKKTFKLPPEDSETENIYADKIKMVNIYNLQLQCDNLHLIGNSCVGRKTQLLPLNPLKEPLPLLDHEVRGRLG